MFVHLGSEFESIQIDILMSSYGQVLENLINAHSVGHHIFLPSARVLDLLLVNNDQFSARQVACLKNIKDEYAFLSGHGKDIDFSVLAVPDGSTASPEQENQKVIFPASHFSNYTSCSPTALLVENAATDGTFLKLACACLARGFGFNHVGNISVMNGGGGSIVAEFARFIDDRHPVVCVVDSDKKTPTSNLGENARGITNTTSSTSFLNLPVVLGVREMENHIPLEIILDAYHNCGGHSVIPTIEKLKLLEHAPSDSGDFAFLRHYDLKSTFKRSSIQNESDATKQAFLLAIWAVLYPEETEFGYSDESIAANNVIHDSIGEQIVPIVCDYLSTSPARKKFCAELARHPFYQEFSEIISTILAATTSPRPLATY